MASTSRPIGSFIFFGGKGGVGKTTCAAALAIASARAGRAVLVVSSDPAHSLGDALDVRLSARAAAMPIGRRGAGRLRAVELDAPRALRRWLDEHRRALGDILEHGTWLDRGDVDELLHLAVPGVDELIGLVEIARLAGGDDELVVVDTAPTGHALRMLAAPDAVAAVARVLDDLQREHRYVRERFGRAAHREAADRLIDLLSAQARRTAALLRDPRRTSFRWVMLPEALSLAETDDALTALASTRIRVDTIVVNRVAERGPRCAVCDRRRTAERGVMAQIRRRLGGGRLLQVIPRFAREPRGVAALGEVGALLMQAPRRPVRAGRPGGRETAARRPAVPAERLAIDALRGLRLVLFTGKGGAGKTTCAAATAIALARADASTRVLLLSIDPAHSIGDVLNAQVGDRGIVVEPTLGNLRARELDAAAALAARQAEVRAAADDIAAAFGIGAVSAAGGRGLRELLDLAPPGIDELLGLVSVMTLLDSNEYGTIVVDAAPTGHALRLLDVPALARGWVQASLRLLLKYRDLVRPGRLARELLELSKSIRLLEERLQDPAVAAFVVVTRAAAVPRRETERLWSGLKGRGVPVPVTLINAVTRAPGRCGWCRAIAAAEQRELAQLVRRCRRAFRDCAIIQTPLVEPPPRGVVGLERWARLWMT